MGLVTWDVAAGAHRLSLLEIVALLYTSFTWKMLPYLQTSDGLRFAGDSKPLTWLGEE
jgi:hypothetical protein